MITKDHETDFISTLVLKSFYWYFGVQIPSPALKNISLETEALTGF
jgi:hypothetical protein